MRSIAEQKRSATAEMVRDTMMNTVGGKPVHLGNLEVQAVDGIVGNVRERQMLRILGTLVTHGANQAVLVLFAIAQKQHKVGLVKSDVCLTRRLDARYPHIRDIEKVFIGAALETTADLMPNERPSAITSCQVSRSRGPFPPISLFQGGSDVAFTLFEGQQFGLPFHVHAK
ncbi:hypothetical protein D3C80_1211610 [compost metagenome]